MKTELSINMLLDWVTPDGSQRTERVLWINSVSHELKYDFLNWLMDENSVIFDPRHFTNERSLARHFPSSVRDAREQIESCDRVLSVVDLEQAWRITPPMSYRSNGRFAEPVRTAFWKAYYDFYRLGPVNTTCTF